MKVQGNENKQERLALYGGAFDPVHSAHLKVARYALEQARLDRVVFIPASQSPLKVHAPLTNNAARLQMLDLALQDEPCFVLDAYELEQGGMSYTVETVRYFCERFAGAELFWIIGGDQFELLERWRRIDELAEMVTFLVLARPGAHIVPNPELPYLRYQVIEAPLMSVSSSEIRERCGTGRSIEGLVPDAVEAFISERELYTNLK